MPGDSVIELCELEKVAPNGETHKCYEELDHSGNHICCDEGVWNQDSQWVVIDDPYDPFPLDGSFDISEVIFPQTKVEDSWEDGLY